MTWGRVTAFPYSRLATRLKSLAIILLYIYTYYHSHRRLQPYSNNYHPYAYEAERWRTCPYTWLVDVRTTNSYDCNRYLKNDRISWYLAKDGWILIRTVTLSNHIGGTRYPEGIVASYHPALRGRGGDNAITPEEVQWLYRASVGRRN